MAWPDRKAVLVPIDFSDPCFGALREALSMVAAPAAVTALHVVPDLVTEIDYLHAAFDPQANQAEAEKVLRASVDRIDPGVAVKVVTGDAGEVIARTAAELGCDLIVIPSHGRSGISRLMLGSVAERVLRHAPCPVLVLRVADQK